MSTHRVRSHSADSIAAFGYRPISDLARIGSAALIVCFHAESSPYKHWTISGLAYFVALMFCFQACGSSRKRPNSIHQRGVRLLVPWIIWSLFYGLVQLRLSADFKCFADNLLVPSNLLIGTTIHLWFLPFAFVGAVGCHFLLRINALQTSFGGLLLGLLSVMLAEIGSVTKETLPAPFSQWMYAAPLIPISLAIGLSQRRPKRILIGNYTFLLSVAALMAWRYGEPSYFIGSTAAAVSLLYKTQELKALKYFADLSIGIYLIHPVVFLVIYKFFPSASWPIFALAGFTSAAVITAAIVSLTPYGVPLFGIMSAEKSVAGPCSANA